MSAIKDRSMFGRDFKYIFVLTALAWMTYTLPSVQAAFVGAVADIGPQVAAASTSYECPPGFICNAVEKEKKPFFGIFSSRPSSTTDDKMMRPSPAIQAVARKGISPQDVVTILIKEGIIPQEKVSQARTIIAQLEKGHASSTPLMSGEFRKEDMKRLPQPGQATSSKPLPMFQRPAPRSQ